MAKANRVQVFMFKDNDGKDLLRYDAGDPQATLTIARATADQLEVLADAIGQVITEMRGATPPAGTTGTTPPGPETRRRTV